MFSRKRDIGKLYISRTYLRTAYLRDIYWTMTGYKRNIYCGMYRMELARKQSPIRIPCIGKVGKEKK